jgi:hypothetical protein
MRVAFTTVLEIPPEAMNVNALEHIIAKATSQFTTDAWNAVARGVEEEAEAQYGGRLKRKGREARWLWTRNGPAHLQRQRYLDPAESKSFLLFDQRVCLEAGQRVTPAAQQICAELAAIGPSFQAVCLVLERVFGESPAAGTLWNWTQAVGRRLEQKAQAARTAFFRDGELPGAELRPKPFVAVEADSTFVHAWRQKGRDHEVYLGVAYDGKAGEKRRRLTGKVAVTSCEGSNVFGQDLFVAVQARHNVCEAATVLFTSDGAASLESIRDQLFPMATHQLERAHLVRRTREAYTWAHAEAGAKALSLLLAEKKVRFAQKLERDRRRYPEQAGALNELAGYVLPRWDWLFVTRHLRRQGCALPPHVEGSGAIERNVGVYIGQRLKHRGMGWTKRGASHILRLRLQVFLQAS